MGLKILFVFGKIYVDIVDRDVSADVVGQIFFADTVVQWCCDDISGWSFCWCVDADLVHSDGGMYFQSFCLQWGQSFNGMDSFQSQLYLEFEI